MPISFDRAGPDRKTRAVFRREPWRMTTQLAPSLLINAPTPSGGNPLEDLLSHFQKWHAGKVRRIGYRVYHSLPFTLAQCRGSFFAQTFTTASNPPHYSGKKCSSSRVQQAEAGSDVLIPLCRSRDLQHTLLLSAVITINSLDIFIDVFYVCVSAFSTGDICFLFVINFVSVAR